MSIVIVTSAQKDTMSKVTDTPRESTQSIDPDKVAENPGLLPYAHHVGSAIIRPLDKGKSKGLAMSAMFEQTGTSLQRIKEQVEILIRQAQDIHDRIDISERIYNADCGFEPIVSRTYHLYERSNGEAILSMIAPDEWGRTQPYTWLATAELLSDHTWKVLERSDEAVGYQMPED